MISIKSISDNHYCNVCTERTATMYELRLEAIIVTLCVRCKCKLRAVMENESRLYDGY